MNIPNGTMINQRDQVLIVKGTNADFNYEMVPRHERMAEEELKRRRENGCEVIDVQD